MAQLWQMIPVEHGYAPRSEPPLKLERIVLTYPPTSLVVEAIV